ncbi:MAG: molybdopterin dinucleotide binding domain-containing protein [Acidimicrobiia bacterium]
MCGLEVHVDANEAGVTDCALARITSEADSIDVPVEISDEMMPGVVSPPHGWGHDKPDTRLSFAREHAGVNNNLARARPPRRQDLRQRGRERHPRRGRPRLRATGIG